MFLPNRVFYVAYNETPMKGHAMLFRNRKIQVTLVPREREATSVDGDTTLDKFEKIVDISQDAVVSTAVALGSIYAATRVVKTVCKVIEVAAKAHL